MLIRFYFFTFYDHFVKKQFKKDAPVWFRATLVMAMSIFCLFLALLLILKISIGYDYKSRVGVEILISFLSFAFVYIFCLKGGMAARIYGEFRDSSFNNRKNRTIAWLVWLITFLTPIILTLIDKKTY